ncbi:MAG: hypothetical protein KKG60_00740 [Nanoarchaeota archaeon]|nr:hypothetical protein [Nanoarchaeota archaeon]
MFEQYINRENTIFKIMQEFLDAGLYFIVIGGYAVSAFKHRFSVDLDIVIKESDKEKFMSLLSKKGLRRTIMRKLDHIYAPEFIRYEVKNKLPVSIDLFIGGVGSRTTDASFSFEQLKENSEKRNIIGLEKEIVVRIPKKEMLIILKLHSGRLTDFRDIAALGKNMNLDLIRKFVWKGKKSIVKKNIKRFLSLLEDKNFMDGFKGVFIEKKYDVDTGELKKLKWLLER